MRTLIISLVILSLGLLTITWLISPDSNLHLVMCDVGQGDGFLLQQGSTQVVIDGGPSPDAMLSCIKHHIPFWDTTIELMVASHADADHIGGLSAILSAYSVSAILYNQSTKETTVFKQFDEAVQMSKGQGSLIFSSKKGMTFDLGPNFSAVVLHPDQSSEDVDSANRSGSNFQSVGVAPPISEHILQAPTQPEVPKSSMVKVEENDRSIILFIQFHDQTYVFTGDAGTEIELALLQNPLISEVDVLKTSHHGSKSGTSQQFLDVTRPEWTLISVGKSNSYGHPHAEVLERLRLSGAQVVRTDLLGEVELISDGTRLWTKQE